MSKKAKKPYIFVIIGGAGAGKTTLLTSLQKKLLKSETYFSDMDENRDVPPEEAGRGFWRRYRLEQMLYDAVVRYKSGTSTVLSGVMTPHEIVEAPAYSPNLNLHFIYLKVSKRSLKERLQARVPKRTTQKEVNEALKGYAKFQKMLEAQVLSQRRHLVVRTDVQSSREVRDEVLEFIERLD